MAEEEVSKTQTPYGSMNIPIKKEKNQINIGLTIFKAIEAVLSLYCSLFIYQFFIHEDTLLIIYISWPVFGILDIVIILDRLFNHKREVEVLVFEVVTSFLGFITHLLCAILLMYIFNMEKDVRFDVRGTIIDRKFTRHVLPAVFSTTAACFYLLDCLLSADALFDHWGIQPWTSPAFPNQVDPKPSTSFRMVLPKLSLVNKICHTKRPKPAGLDKNEK